MKPALRERLEPRGDPTLIGSVLRAAFGALPFSVVGLALAFLPSWRLAPALSLPVLVPLFGLWWNLQDDLQRRRSFLLQWLAIPCLLIVHTALAGQLRALLEGLGAFEGQLASLSPGLLLAPVFLHLGCELYRLGFPAWLSAPALGFCTASFVMFAARALDVDTSATVAVASVLCGAGLLGLRVAGARLADALVGPPPTAPTRLPQGFENLILALVASPLLGWLAPDEAGLPLFLALSNSVLLACVLAAWAKGAAVAPPPGPAPTAAPFEDNIVHLPRVALSEGQKDGPYHHRVARLATRFRAEKLGFKLLELPPGSYSAPYHFHLHEEEVFYVLSGTVRLRQGARVRTLVAGDLVFFRAGEAGAHQLRNDGDGPCRLLAVANRDPSEVVTYPESAKVYVDALRRCFPMGAAVPFLHGERRPDKTWPEPLEG